MEDEQLSLPEAAAGDQNMPGVCQVNVGGFAASIKHYRKRSHDGMISCSFSLFVDISIGNWALVSLEPETIGY